MRGAKRTKIKRLTALSAVIVSGSSGIGLATTGAVIRAGAERLPPGGVSVIDSPTRRGMYHPSAA